MLSELEVELPDDATAPAIARRYLRELGARMPEELLEDAVVLVSEVVTNAVRHGLPEIGFQIQVSDLPPTIRVRVVDRGEVVALRVSPAEPDQLGGRGLLVLEALASAWGTVSNDPPPGKAVWFEMTLAS